MTAKRFWYDFEDANGHKIVDFINDKKYALETVGDFWEVVDLMNEFHEENTHINNTIQEQYNNERTQIGKNTLKQLIEAIQ